MAGYREHSPPPALASVVACTWERVTHAPRSQLVIPDTCTDLIRTSEGELIVAGPDTGPRIVELRAGTRTTGVRLRPGAVAAVLGVPASALRDCTPSAEEVLGPEGRRLTETVVEARAPAAMLLDAVAARLDEPDPLVVEATRLLGVPGTRVAGVADLLGVSERQLHRRTSVAVGYGPKLLARVLRLRRLVGLRAASLAERALDAGYADQAHMTEDVRRLTGLTPVRFLKDARLTAA
jgi:AraC-like DNA-binding protein